MAKQADFRRSLCDHKRTRSSRDETRARQYQRRIVGRGYIPTPPPEAEESE